MKRDTERDMECGTTYHMECDMGCDMECNLQSLMSASREELTARDSSMGSSGGTTEVRMSVHSRNSLYLLRSGSSVPA